MDMAKGEQQSNLFYSVVSYTTNKFFFSIVYVIKIVSYFGLPMLL